MLTFVRIESRYEAVLDLDMAGHGVVDQSSAVVVIRCRSLTVAKVDSIGLVVRRWIQ